jgi:hypothetical protein
MKKMLVIAPMAFVLLALTIVAAGSSADSGKVRAQPGTFDPDKTKSVVADWKPGVGLPDAGGSNHGLILEKNAPDATNSAAGASILGAEGASATGQLGFDIKNGGHCTGGSPRYNLQASDGFHFIGGCGNGTQTPGPAPGWTRVRFDMQNPGQAFPAVAPGATIVSLTLIADEQGQSTVDNLYINGPTIEKPGNSK